MTIEVNCFAMRQTLNGDFTSCEPNQAEFWDVVVTLCDPDTGQIDVLEEHEDIEDEQVAGDVFSKMEAKWLFAESEKQYDALVLKGL